MSFMKKFFLFILILISVCAHAQIEKVVPKKPSPPRLVNDFTSTLTPEQVAALEQKLVTYDDSTSNQVAVVIIPTTGDYRSKMLPCTLSVIGVWVAAKTIMVL